jgi:hypothetical protein
MDASAGVATGSTRAEKDTGLRRAIGLKLLFFFILGDMLGGGIYALVGEVGLETGGAIWTEFKEGTTPLLAIVAGTTLAFYALIASRTPSTSRRRRRSPRASSPGRFSRRSRPRARSISS